MLVHLIVENFKNIDNNLAIHLLTWAMIFDILTGYAKSIIWGVTDSNVGWKGLIKHALVFTFFLILYPYAGAFGWAQFVNILSMIYVGNYVISIMENFGVMGIYVPKFLENKVKTEIKRYEQMAENLIVEKTNEITKRDDNSINIETTIDNELPINKDSTNNEEEK